uniref:Stress-associated protein n=1 Tax=Aeluropus littoralis TaxID=110874 RepID=A0A2I2MQC8_9POAL|nr:stress-associated protein [Aeluropus littoralis]
MSRLATVALPRGVAATRDLYSWRLSSFAPAFPRLFSADASGEASAATSAAAGSQEDSFLKASDEGVAYGRFYSVVPGGNNLGRDMLKTDIIHCLDKCDLSLEDVKIDYNRGYYPMGALLRFPSKASFTSAVRQISQARLYRLEQISRDQWDLKQSLGGKALLLQGVPRNAVPEDIERFLCGINFEPPPFESFLRPGVPDPIRMVLVKCPTKTDAMNAFITKNRSFCLNSPVSIRVLQ